MIYSKLIIAGDTSNPNNVIYWKQGGSFFRDCITWTIRRDDWKIGPVDVDPQWAPRSKTCKIDSDCEQTVWPCQGTCQMDPDNTDYGWCPCPGTGMT